MNPHPPVPPTRRTRVVILAAFIAALLSPQLTAQTTITYTDGQTDSTARSLSAPNDPTTLTIASGVATQSGILSGTKARYDLTITRRISKAVGVPVVASGGAGTLQHMVEVLDAGKADAVLAASIFHTGTYTVGDVKQ